MRSFPSQVSFPFLLLLLLLIEVVSSNRPMDHATNRVGRPNHHTNKKVGCNDHDQNILLIFKQGVLNSSNQLSSWTSQKDCCLWEGVLCDNIAGRVIKLVLAGHELEGVINLSLLQLQFLNYLDLSNNLFTNVCIPPCQVSKFHLNNQSFSTSYSPTMNFSSPLRYLDFSYNHLSLNDLGWLSQLPSLKYLNLSDNDIGSEPKWLQHVAMLPSLSELSLENCGLRDFPFYNYANFTSLKTLVLRNKNISSKFPDSFLNVAKHISYIDLQNNSFYGGLPIALFKLPNLNYLSLYINSFEGSIPSLVGNLSSLTTLDLSYNYFSGSLPESLGLSSLTTLDLSYNYFSGSLPESLGQLHKLIFLDVSDNSWEGVISERNFANLTSLESLRLMNSPGFKFHFDPNWVPPFQLLSFYSDNTSLGPNFPAWLSTQRSLWTLSMSGSEISNIDAHKFGSLIATIVYFVDLSNNLISGDISDAVLNSESINLDNNNFTGGLPHITANVSAFGASNNSFSGSIFPLLCPSHSNGEYMALVFLDLSYNHLSGILPDCWENLKWLGHMNLRGNKLTGKLPPSMASLMLLRTLILQDNNFFGKLLMNMSNWTRLDFLILKGNDFSGSLPNLMPQNLVVLNLRANQFMGNIPSQFCKLSSLTMLDLAENKLSGSIPHCLYNLTRPDNASYWDSDTIQVSTKGRKLDYKFGRALYPKGGVIDLSANVLSGEIPKELFGTSQMQTLNLSQNQLIGKVPKEIGDVRNLESLDLNYNKLSGEIPLTISNLSFLAYLNLSYNNFIGQIPLGTQIQSFDSWSFVGNHELCGDPLPRKCNKKEETHHESKSFEGNQDDNFLKSLYLGMGVGFAAGFWGVCGSLFLIREWRHIFFRWFGHLVDKIYVAWVLYFKRFI